MMLKKSFPNANQVYLTGLTFFLLGILCDGMGHGAFPAVFLHLLLPGTGIPDKVAGFMTGLSVPFLMAGIYFQLRSLKMRNLQA